MQKFVTSLLLLVVGAFCVTTLIYIYFKMNERGNTVLYEQENIKQNATDTMTSELSTSTSYVSDSGDEDERLAIFNPYGVWEIVCQVKTFENYSLQAECVPTGPHDYGKHLTISNNMFSTEGYSGILDGLADVMHYDIMEYRDTDLDHYFGSRFSYLVSEWIMGNSSSTNVSVCFFSCEVDLFHTEIPPDRTIYVVDSDTILYTDGWYFYKLIRVAPDNRPFDTNHICAVTIAGTDYCTSLTKLSFFEMRLTDKDIESLQYMTKLESLSINNIDVDNCISDITPLGTIESIKKMELSCSQLRDLSPLAGLKNLQSLILNRCYINDLSSLAGLQELYRFSLSQCEITNLSVLDDLQFLTELRIYYSQIDDITPLAIHNLYLLELYNNQISDLTPLAGLYNLTHLDLCNNQISDISPLAGLVNLQFLDIGENAISDLSPLSGLRHLRLLSLCKNLVHDLSPIAELQSLETLYLSRNQIMDISLLAGYDLYWLELDHNMITDISPLASLTNLEGLCLDNNNIDDLSPLSELVELTYLSIEGNGLSDITPLSNLVNLERLFLSVNRIEDLSPLSDLTFLYYVRLECNHITDWSPVAHVKQVVGRGKAV